MSNQRKIKHMTSEELKAKLFAHFQKNGSFDNLKSQVRGQLISELIKMSEPVKSDAFPPASDVEKCLLPLQVCNWLVYDHLARQDYQYSLSVFVVEARVPSPDKFLTAGDILGLLGLGRKDTDAANVAKLYSEKNELGFLHSLLLAIIKATFNVTGRLPSSNSNLPSSKAGGVTKEESIASQRKDKNETELRTNSKRHGLEKSVCSNSLEKSSEISFQEQLESVKEESEKEVQKLRERLLQEVKKFHDKEQELQIEVESEKAELKNEKAKLKKELELLKDKESLMEKEIQNKYEQKLRGVEADVASKLHWKDKELEAFKEKFNEKEQELSEVKKMLSTERNSQNILKRELDDLKYVNKALQEKYSALLEENTNLLKKFESMADYAVLKEEVASKSREVLRLQMEIKDIHNQSETERRKYVETVRSLEDNLSIKEPELLQTQKELDSVLSTLSKKEIMWNKERKKMEQDLNKFKELQRSLMQKVEDQEEDIKDLHETIRTLNYKFINSSLTSNRNELPNCKNYQASERNTNDPLFVKRGTNYSTTYPGIISDRSLQFLSDAKSRLGRLAKEEDRVQEKSSFIFSSFSLGEKKYEKSLKGFDKFHKNNAQASFKPQFSNTGFDFEEWYKNKVVSRRNEYSLDEIKQLVSQSVLSNKPTLVSDFNRNCGLLEAAISTSKVNDWFKRSDDQPIIDLNCQNNPAAAKEVTDSFVTVLDKTVLKGADDACVKESIPFDHPTDSLTAMTDDSLARSGKETFIKNKSKENADIQNQTNLKNPDTAEVKSSQVPENARDSEISEITSAIDKNSSVTKPTNPVSVNLDEAWKRRVSNPSVLLPLPKSREIETSKPQGLMSFNPFSVSSKTTFSKTINRNDALEYETTPPTISNNAVAQNIKDYPINDAVCDNAVLEPKTSFMNLESLSERSEVLLTTPEKSSSCGTDAGKTVLDKLKNASDLGNNPTVSQAEESNRNNLKSTLSMEHQSSSKLNGTEKTLGEAPDKSEDSVSELSEIHLSCGSEGEQQKDDPDVW